MSLDDLLNLSDAAVQVPDSQVHDARIARDRSTIDPVFVVIPDFDHNLLFGPAPWSPVARADGLYYPKKGDRAVVVRSGPDTVWIVGWTPTANTPDVIYG